MVARLCIYSLRPVLAFDYEIQSEILELTLLRVAPGVDLTILHADDAAAPAAAAVAFVRLDFAPPLAAAAADS